MAYWDAHAISIVGPPKDIARFVDDFGIVAVTGDILEEWEGRPAINLGPGLHVITKCEVGGCSVQIEFESVGFSRPNDFYRSLMTAYPTDDGGHGHRIGAPRDQAHHQATTPPTNSCPDSDRYRMGSFSNWLAERHPGNCSPAPNGILMAIKMAGAEGITRRELGSLFDLDGELLTKLLLAFVGVGMVAASRENGQMVFRAVW